MSILKIARLGHPVLRKVAEPVDPDLITGPEIQRLIKNMIETMVEYRGVGLAAPQVHESIRLALCAGEEDENGRGLLRVLINPEVKTLTEETYGMYEGCLSLPGMRGYVERPTAISVKALDGRGEPLEMSLEGFPAVVTQHELDHLDGHVFVDRIQDMSRFGFEEEAQRYLAADTVDDDDDEDETQD